MTEFPDIHIDMGMRSTRLSSHRYGARRRCAAMAAYQMLAGPRRDITARTATAQMRGVRV